MKKLFLYGGFGLAISLSFSMVHAASIIKTNAGDLSYFDQLQIFRRGQDDTVRGWVRLNRGFAVASRASAFMDTFITVSGPMDLGETGTLVLSGNLFLDKSVTLTSGGNIKGKASAREPAGTIFLGGDLTLAATTYTCVLHITGDWSNSGTTGDLIIDGMGHTLDIQDRAQIFVDSNITLTLRNMTIRTGPKSLMTPAIRLASMGSKLALDNVMFDLGADFQFKQGQIFVHNEVAVTGTSAFMYQSPKPSYITSGATWSFEEGTTFSVAPATYTDQPYIAGYATSNNFIVLADASSALGLNGCSLKTTYTGLRLTRGMVLFDNQVPVDTQAGVYLAATPLTFVCSITTGNNPQFPAWSPDGRFIASANYGSNTLQVFRFTGSAGVQVGATVTTGTNPYFVDWSPDGRFLALVNWGSLTLQIYRFTGNSTLIPVGGAVSTAAQPLSVRWSPDGRFVAVVNGESPSIALQVFRFNGASAPISMGTAAESGGSNPTSIDWSPDGRFIVVTDQIHAGTNAVQVFQFNGQSAPTLLGVVSALLGAWAVGGRWSPDGRFISIANGAAHQIGYIGVQVFRFNGTSTITSVGTASVQSGVNASNWSPDGQVVGVSGANYVSLYRNNVASDPVKIADVPSTGVTSLWWSPDGKYIAAGTSNVSPGSINIYRCNYVYSGQSQAFSTGLVFGDSAKGSNFDATIDIMGNTRVGVKGKVMDDSA